MRMSGLVTVAAILASAAPARAALVLEYIQVSSITALQSAGPALTSLTMAPGETVFLQVALRDTIGAGPNFGQPGTVPWQTNGGNAGPGSLGLGAFFTRFDGIPGVAVNPSPTVGSNARLVDPVTYGTVTSGTSPPNFTRIGGLLFACCGSDPGAVPDPFTHRVGLFNLRIQALQAGAGTVRLSDPNPALTSADNALLHDGDNTCQGACPGWAQFIDDLLFGPTFTNTFDLPVVVTPEPSALALVALAAAFGGAGRLGRIRRPAREKVPKS